MPAKPGKKCVESEMKRWKAGELHSGTGKKGKDGPVVKDQKQAIAIALSVCGKSNYAEHLVNLGFSEEAAFEAAELLSKAPDWDNHFLTGETLSRTPREERTVIAPSLPGMDIDNRPGRQPGSQGKHKNRDAQGIYPMMLPWGNPQQGPRSRSDLKGMAAFEEVKDPLTGQCKQKEKREKRQQERSPDQQQADKERASEMAGKPVAPNADRQAAAKKAAETRKKCKEGNSDAKPQSSTTLASGAGGGVTSRSSSSSSNSGAGGGAGSGAGGGAGSGAR